MQEMKSRKKKQKMFEVKMSRVKAKKELGQNFLSDANLLHKIAVAAEIEDGYVLEIGPGPGGLTKSLICLARYVLAVEVDLDFTAILGELQEKHPNLDVVFMSILDFDFGDYCLKHHLSNRSWHLVANIPYYLTSKIIFWYQDQSSITSATLMVQEEFGQRLLAIPKTKSYNALSVIFQLTNQLMSSSEGDFILKKCITKNMITNTRKIGEKRILR
jgi:16S rRNA (adenine1518-N6/adenine1519-N6)-dimethyltransferase